MDEKGLGEEIVLPQSESTGIVSEIRTAVLDGTTYYFIRLNPLGIFYSINAADNLDVITLDVGDTVTIEHAIPEEGIGSSILDGYTLVIDERGFWDDLDNVADYEFEFTVNGESVPTIEAGAEVPFQFKN